MLKLVKNMLYLELCLIKVVSLMLLRLIKPLLISSAEGFYAISLVGPRQSGKTTLLKMLFPDHQYINLEEPDTLARAKADPRGMLSDTRQAYFFDEAQEYPDIFSYLLSMIDQEKINGQFILSGSQNFMLLDSISQSLAGRVAVLELLPLAYKEVISTDVYKSLSIWDFIYRGSYPALYQSSQVVDLWYRSYVKTYIQRDVRQLLNVRDVTQFYLFLRLCAARNGQIVNVSELSGMCGVSHATICDWFAVLETSYIVFRLQPYYRNFNKRIVKSFKLYFYDMGLVCHLLGIESSEHASIHASRGALFEGVVIGEVVKLCASKGQVPNLYFWCNQNGFEVDLLIERGDMLHAIEIKSSATFSPNFLKGLKRWQGLVSQDVKTKTWVVYGGDQSFVHGDSEVLSCRDIHRLYEA